MNNPKPATQNRRSRRLKGYDYSSPGVYFVTIVTHARECLFGKVVDGEVRLNNTGQMVEQCLQSIPGRFPIVQIDGYVIMPNHFHGLFHIVEPDDHVGVGLALPDDGSLDGVQGAASPTRTWDGQRPYIGGYHSGIQINISAPG